MDRLATEKIRVEGVTKSFSTPGGESIQSVERADLVVAEGELLVILGPSGCGKSTLLRIVAGLESATSGQVYIDGVRVTGPGRDRGMVFQSYTSFPWRTVEDNIGFGLELHGVAKGEKQATINHYLEVTGLDHFRHRYPKDLSGGMRQRVAIARTLANAPQVLLMDEPFGALDAQTRWQMQELLLEIWSETRTTVLFVTHDVEEALYLADRIYISTARPSRRLRELEVPFGRPRATNLKSSEAFTHLEQEILSAIRHEAMAARSASSLAQPDRGPKP